ncbi:hypothetical protein EES42_10840 [Streptomyces sp. ADI95-17]|nr:hypothetical protein EES42_10840 [Streptomyces sp. ADI95-17]
MAAIAPVSRSLMLCASTWAAKANIGICNSAMGSMGLRKSKTSLPPPVVSAGASGAGNATTPDVPVR